MYPTPQSVVPISILLFQGGLPVRCEQDYCTAWFKGSDCCLPDAVRIRQMLDHMCAEETVCPFRYGVQVRQHLASQLLLGVPCPGSADLIRVHPVSRLF